MSQISSSHHGEVQTQLHDKKPQSIQSQGIVSRLAVDVFAAFAASLTCAPFVSLVDQALTLHAAESDTLLSAFLGNARAALRRPVVFLSAMPFRWLCIVYTSTFAAANGANTLSAAHHISPKIPVLAASTAANMTSCIAKDRAFARMFGTIAPTALPLGSYGLFFTRDVLSMAFVFTVPVLAADALRARGKHSPSTELAVQMSAPVLVQFLTTPLHLLALNLYNRPAANVWARARTVIAQLPQSIVARCVRIIPPFSMGSVLNREVRNAGHRLIDTRLG